MSLSGLLGLSSGGRAAVIGCGGKTSLIALLARELDEQKVLVTPTARIRPMQGAALCITPAQCLRHQPRAGIQCFGVLDEATGKLTALPLALLSELQQSYDLVLMEADGSRGLLCKGYEPYEPVIPDFATHTIGVVNILALNRPATPETVHHLPLFLTQTGLSEGDPIDIRAIAAMLCHPGGMLRRRIGKTALVINGVTDQAQLRAARRLLEAVLANCSFTPDACIAGCTRNTIWHAL